ncbi:hypothetical protein [Mesorhizobium sp. M1252]|uniref:hypothetical protein n=1 Tax=Mesorhizobium sp. M1252 TaxID=2957073 RepID=UPI00333E0A14
MVLSDLLFFSPVILGGVGMILSKVPDMIDAITGDHGQADFERFMMDAGRRGLSYSDSMRELDIRTIFARLRREASGAVAIDVQNWATSWRPPFRNASPTTRNMIASSRP